MTPRGAVTPRLGRERPRIAGRRRAVGSALVALAVAACALWLSARGVDRRALGQALAGADLRWLAAAGLANAVTVVAQSLAWRLGLDVGGVGRLPLRHVVAATWIGKAVNQLLPANLGEIARVAAVRRHAPRGPGQLPRIVGSLVAQRLLASLATFGVVVGTALWLPVPVHVPGGRVAPLAALAVVVVALMAVRRFRPWQRVRGLVPDRLRPTTDAVAGGSALLRPGRPALQAVGCHAVAIGAQLGSMGLLLRAFDIAAPATAPVMLLALVAIAGVVPAPGGLGVTQVAIVAPLGVSYGVPASSALAFALGMQATVAAVALGGGLLALLHQRVTRSTAGLELAAGGAAPAV